MDTKWLTKMGMGFILVFAGLLTMISGMEAGWLTIIVGAIILFKSIDS